MNEELREIRAENKVIIGNLNGYLGGRRKELGRVDGGWEIEEMNQEGTRTRFLSK